MSISRRRILGFLATAPLVLEQCKTTSNVSQSAAENKNSVEQKPNAGENPINIKGFKIMSPEGSEGLCHYSNNGKIAGKYMQIISEKENTITDLAWNNYQINNLVKRWKFDELEWKDEPLINYSFSKAYIRKDISIEVAFFSKDNSYYPVKIYQQLIRLG